MATAGQYRLTLRFGSGRVIGTPSSAGIAALPVDMYRHVAVCIERYWDQSRIGLDRLYARVQCACTRHRRSALEQPCITPKERHDRPAQIAAAVPRDREPRDARPAAAHHHHPIKGEPPWLIREPS